MTDVKPFMGKIREWYRWAPDPTNFPNRKGVWRNWTKNKGYIIQGLFDGHEQFTGEFGGTSLVIGETKTPGEDVIEIETLNSKYLLIGAPLAEGVVHYGSPESRNIHRRHG